MNKIKDLTYLGDFIKSYCIICLRVTLHIIWYKILAEWNNPDHGLHGNLTWDSYVGPFTWDSYVGLLRETLMWDSYVGLLRSLHTIPLEPLSRRSEDASYAESSPLMLWTVCWWRKRPRISK